ncbi:MAG: protein kinase [Planctomycetia bacterium]|nr:protein kinase [Planctomycetia bacterium]
MLTPPRDPDEVEQTLLPTSVLGFPRSSSARPDELESPDTPSHPGARDATLIDSAASPHAQPVENAEVTSMSSGTGASDQTEPPPSGNFANAASEVTSASVTVNESDPDATLLTPASGTSESATVPSVPVAAGGPAPGPMPNGSSVPSSSTTGTMVGRFALKALHARGGLGEVFTARDSELNREVVVKRMKSQYADDPASRRRFLTEAELTAKLDHPGVVPVFGLVNDARGRPCYAMRFIRGETLKDEIDRYHNQETGDRTQGTEKTEDRRQRAEDRSQKTEKSEEKSGEASSTPTQPGACENQPRTVAFRHLLHRFISVCQAIAYAHTRNIIHRDIKPANVMVGTFGETLVVDWGLAKALDDGPDYERMMKAAVAAGLRRDPDATELPSHMTMAGTAIGTPAYMSPEQAAGKLELVGPKADVYALGATLFAILTGKAPFTGSSAVETLDRVRRGAFEHPITVNPECPKPLDAICRKAMALSPEDRYPTALELAADVERWLSDEPVSCYSDPLAERLARWARRHPARVATCVSLLLAGVFGAAVVALAVNEGRKNTQDALTLVIEQEKETAAQRDRATAAEKATAAERDKVVEQKKETEEQRKQAVAARDVARGRYEKALSAYNTLVYDIDRRLGDRAGMQELRETLLLRATDGLQSLIAGAGEDRLPADRTLVAAYRQMGEVYQMLGKTAKAQEQFRKAVLKAIEVQTEAKTPSEKRAADRDLAQALDKLAGIYLLAGDTATALETVNNAIRLFEKLAQDQTDVESQQGLAAARARRAAILLERGETTKATEDCKFAHALRAKLAASAPDNLELKRDLAASFDELAGLQLHTARTTDALANARKSLILRLEINEKAPKRPDVRRELAAAHARLGEVYFHRALMTDSVKQYSAGVDVLLELTAEDSLNAGAKTDQAMMYGRLGHAQIRTGELDEAVANTKRGKELCEELGKLDSNSVAARRNLALARECFGDALLAAGRFDEALAEYTASVKLLRPLYEADPKTISARIELARGLEHRGDGLLAIRDMPNAVIAFTESVKLREGIVADDPGSASAKREWAVALNKLADAYCASGGNARARVVVIDATNMFVELAKADPDSGQAKRDLAVAYGKWGQVLSPTHPTGALILWLNSLERFQTIAALDVGNAQAKEDEARAWERLASCYATHGQRTHALSAATKALRLWTELGDAAGVKTKAGRQRLALAMLRIGDISTDMEKFANARAWYKKAQAEVAGLATDTLCGPVAKLIADQMTYLDAVEAGMKNPAAVKKFPAHVQVAALRTVVELELRADRPVNADGAAGELAKVAKSADELFIAARCFASCVTSSRATDVAKNTSAKLAVETLQKAIKEGFRNPDALSGPEWDAVSARVPEFATIRAELEKLRDK